MQVPYYVVFNRYTDEIKPFHLVDGHYEAMDFSSDGRLDMPELGLSLGLWQGAFQRISRLWLRWFTLDGELIQTSDEEVVEAKQEVELAKQEAVKAKQKAAKAKEAIEVKKRVEKLEGMLRQLGINPDEIK